MRPVIINDEDALVGLLRGRRQSMGISQQALDDRLGFPDCYVAKLEAPNRSYGRRAVWGMTKFLSYWLEGLGVALVLMDRNEAQALVAASTGEDAAVSQHVAYPGRTRERQTSERRILTTRFVFPGKPA